MIVIAVIMMVLGVVAIGMGFSIQYPEVRVSGSVFFVGGWLMLSLDRIVWGLEKIHSRLKQEKEQEKEPE